MRPDGIGRCGSLSASTWRSNQSLTAWLVAQTIGPASTRPATTIGQRGASAAPDETTPQPNAQIGGNQVIGFNSSRTAAGWIRGASGAGAISVMAALPLFQLAVFFARLGEAVAPQLDVEALPAEPEHLGRGGAVVAGQLERGLDAHSLDHIGGLAHELFQRHPADQLRELLARARNVAVVAAVAGDARADIADGETEPGLAGCADRGGGNFDIDRRAMLAADDAGEQLHAAVLAQIGQRSEEIDRRLADPAVDGLAQDLMHVLDLGELQEGGVGVQQSAVH